MSRKYSTEIMNAVDTFLTIDDWHHSFNEAKGLFRFGLALKGKMKHLDYVADIQEEELMIYAYTPIAADCDDEELMNRMARFICRANYGLKNGAFELDMRDGEIRYKSYIDCENQIPSQAAIRNSIYATAVTFERYAPGILAINFADADDEEAIQMCEGD